MGTSGRFGSLNDWLQNYKLFVAAWNNLFSIYTGESLDYREEALWRLRRNGCHSVNSKTEWYIILVPFCWLLTEWITVWMPFCCFQIIQEQKTEWHQHHVPFCLSQSCHSLNCENRMTSISCINFSFPILSFC